LSPYAVVVEEENFNAIEFEDLLNPKHEIRNSKQSQMTKFQIFETDKSLRILNFEH